MVMMAVEKKMCSLRVSKEAEQTFLLTGAGCVTCEVQAEAEERVGHRAHNSRYHNQKQRRLTFI